MEWLERMNASMDYIEENLDNEIDINQAAKIAYCSVYHFQRMFSFITGVSLAEYIRRRRLTLAAFELQKSHVKVIDVALKYGYESPEAFSRAFKSMHGVMPMSARGSGTALKAFPRMSFHISIRGDSEMNYRVEEKEPFKMAGISVEMSVVNNEQYQEIPNLWLKLMVDGTIDKMHRDFGINEDECVNAALYNFREGVFSYMIGVVVKDGFIPEGYSVLEVPSFTWAVFPTGECTQEETTEAIQKVWKRIYPEWFPTSGYEHADGPEFEMYYTLGENLFNQEVWIPVNKMK